MARSRRSEEAVEKAQSRGPLADEIRRQFLLHRSLHIRLLREADPSDKDAELADGLDSVIPQWDGGKDSRGRNCKDVWVKLAKIAESNEFDPKTWVSVLFSMAYIFSHRVPRPQDLENAEVMERISSWRSHVSVGTYFATMAEIQIFCSEQWNRQQYMTITPEEIARTLIVDPRFDISALVRYAVAHLYKQTDLAVILESAALQQYMLDPVVYEKALEDWLPRRLKELLSRVNPEVKS